MTAGEPVLVIRQDGGGLHTATYAGGGKSGEIRVVDNSPGRNSSVEPRVKAQQRDNTGAKHDPHDVLAPVNGKTSPYSPAGGATMVGVAPATTPSTTTAVEAAAAKNDMFYMAPASPQQCSDFSDALDSELGTGIDADSSKGTEGYREKVDPLRERTGTAGGK